MSSTNEFYFTSADGAARVYVKEWLPEGEPCAILLISHGMAEHKERYLPFMEFLAAHGYACIINDHRGHGGDDNNHIRQRRRPSLSSPFSHILS